MTATENSFRCYKNDKLVYRETYRSDGSLSSTSEWTDDGGFIQNNYDKNGELIK